MTSNGVFLSPPPSLSLSRGADSAVYQLFVRATDGGSVPQVADVPVDVVVLTDSQDLPVFDPPLTGAQGVFLTESDPVGEYIALLLTHTSVHRGSDRAAGLWAST